MLDVVKVEDTPLYRVIYNLDGDQIVLTHHLTEAEANIYLLRYMMDPNLVITLLNPVVPFDEKPLEVQLLIISELTFIERFGVGNHMIAINAAIYYKRSPQLLWLN